VEGPAVEPNASQRADAALTTSPSYELWIAFVVSIVPHAVALFVGGYGHIITNAPLAVVITVVDIAAIVIAYLQFRDDSRAERSSHWLVWATIGLGAVWLIYAVFVGLVILLGQVFCVSQNCRGPLR
jgi:uncharacterized membrane protein YidH (DUF202 family)